MNSTPDFFKIKCPLWTDFLWSDQIQIDCDSTSEIDDFFQIMYTTKLDKINRVIVDDVLCNTLKKLPSFGMQNNINSFTGVENFMTIQKICKKWDLVITGYNNKFCLAEQMYNKHGILVLDLPDSELSEYLFNLWEPDFIKLLSDELN
jgi:hypothetical protein